MSPIRVAALALLRPGEAGPEVLLVRKRGTARFMLPGGKHEAGESDLACLARELAEELALPFAPEGAVRLGRFEASAANEPDRRVDATVYRQDARPDAPHPVAAAEIAEIRWHPVAAPDTGALAPLLTEQLLPRLRASPVPAEEPVRRA